MSQLKNKLRVEEGGAPAAYEPADVACLVRYILDNHLMGGAEEDIPLDRSLVEEGILDSFEIIELVDFIERQWEIRIEDAEITKDNMGSIYKMAAFIKQKTAR